MPRTVLCGTNNTHNTKKGFGRMPSFGAGRKRNSGWACVVEELEKKKTAVVSW